MMLIPAASGPQALGWLGTLGGSQSLSTGVSADGLAVVGRSLTAAGQWRAFRWTPGSGIQDLGTFGGFQSSAEGITWDGSVAVGWAQNAVPNRRAFRWTATGGMQELGTLGGSLSEAYAVSADGSVIVGGSWNASGSRRAFRWTPGSGMQDIGTLGGRSSEAQDVSSDGSMIVGYAHIAGNFERAFRWTVARGMQNLNTIYAHLLGAGSWLAVASAISPNGRYIVGQGYNAATGRQEAFLLDTWETFLPQTFTLLRGLVRSGGLSDLFQSDNKYLRFVPGIVLQPAEAPIQIVVESTAPVTQPLQVTLVWEVATNVPNIEERVELYNFDTGQWDLLRQQATSQQDTRHEVSLRLQGYVSSSREVRAKLSYQAVGPVPLYPWEVRLDEASFAVVR